MATNDPSTNAAELLDAANRAVMNKEFEIDAAPAPTGVNSARGVSLQVSQRDQRENGVLSRTAFNVEGQLYVQETVMQSNGDTKDVWKRGKRPLAR